MRPTYHRISAAFVLLVSALVACCSSPPVLASTLLIKGAGDGHGVGMSQDGDLGYAQHGYSYQAILAHYFTGTALAQASPSQPIRVLLQGNASRVSVVGVSSASGHHVNPHLTYSITLHGRGVLLRGAHGSLGASSLKLTAPTPIRLNGTAENGVHSGTYRGTLIVAPAQHGGINAIEQVGVDDYVRGVVSGEVSADWPAAALDAQAVASRTYALTSDAGGSAFNVYSDTRSQLYRGVAGETTTTNLAVSATAGQIVTYQGKPVTTFFFASSGGKTEDVQNVFLGSPPDPWLQGVPDPYDGGAQRTWSKSFSFSATAARLHGLVRGSFKGIEVLRRGYSPRILSANVLGSGGSTPVSGPELAERLGLEATWAYFSARGAGGSVQAMPDRSGQSPTSPEEASPTPTTPEGGVTPTAPTTGSSGGGTAAG